MHCAQRAPFMHCAQRAPFTHHFCHTQYAPCATSAFRASLLPYSVCTMRNVLLSRITFAILSMHHAQRPPFAHHFCHTQYAPCATSAFRASLLPYSVCTICTSRLSRITFAILSMHYAQHPPLAHHFCHTQYALCATSAFRASYVQYELLGAYSDRLGIAMSF